MKEPNTNARGVPDFSQMKLRPSIALTALENGPSTPKKLIVKKVQVGCAPAEHAEHWKAPEIVESALKYMALIFRKAFNSNNKRDILQRLKEASYNMRPSSRDKLKLTQKLLSGIYH